MTTPTTPYRSDIDALRERKADLERELEEIRARTTALTALQAREQELARALADVDGQIRERGGRPLRRGLPLLDDVRIASPCNASWDEMIGDDRVRFCTSCDKNVFNLSAMSRDEAERLLEERMDAEVCVRFYRRADGTVMTSDCPVGVRKKRVRRVAMAVAGAGAMAAFAVEALAPTCRASQGAVAHDPFVMGEVSSVDEEPHARPLVPPTPPVHSASTTPRVPPDTANERPPVRMGRPVMMGKRAPVR